MADPYVEWIERLHPIEVTTGHVALAQRRHTQIDDTVLEWHATEATREALHLVGRVAATCRRRPAAADASRPK